MRETLVKTLWLVCAALEPTLEVAGRVLERVVGLVLAAVVVIWLLAKGGDPWAMVTYWGGEAPPLRSDVEEVRPPIGE